MADDSSRRSRSRSPPRRAPRGSKGFRWKENTRGKDDSYGRHDSGRRRDYRDRSPNRERERDLDRDRDRNRDRDRDSAGDRERLRSPPRHDSGSKDKGKREKKEKKEKKPTAAPVGAGQEMIIVNVNDRLGTKTAIPCLPSDTIGQLKLMIAARIGRESGQIMLRRQGERPFKDQLSLEDYVISNGVQLDLEVDTGD
ncbi:Ubiquitin-like modifier HUB1 [Tolypocladium ophioglossoides CBS 100239]|uniref:Ubiquitin-like modifier HUB1 n=1 Tax=Tolypocladium ophioglossoides (strain CBS 100239) TaxID=1163406 RepID=A0A0L0NN96_TOLOC|nr:Ubiquitin-like modifier HUB1 [Tolypocladium ophioglossoides CBS 100239]